MVLIFPMGILSILELNFEVITLNNYNKSEVSY